ncbi:MAG TPA: 3-dehydroquinate synthase [Mycobacteriales bacterium]|nr:3-dehydroquinate synthase [Mycobacteriales bacterium]
MTTVIPVAGDVPYDVVVGHGLATSIAPLVAGASTVVTVADQSVADRAAAINDAIGRAGYRVETLTLSAGEAAKSLDTVAGLWDAVGGLRLTRSDAMVAIGGGATTDVVGFVAATWLRGIRVVHVPTTLLGMVDAAVGGKTGINTAAGKNLVGAFHPPIGVLVDLDALATLPDSQWVNGMAEVVKAGFIADPTILDLIDLDPAAAATPSGPHARELIERSIVVKADVVSRDLRESGPREFLNYGHTLGHAIEALEHYQLPHGQAVSIGLVFAAGLGRHAGRLDDVTADRHAELLQRLGLPTTYREDALPELLDAMRIDKKSRGSVQRFVVLDGLGKPAIIEDPDPSLIDAAYAEVAR